MPFANQHALHSSPARGSWATPAAWTMRLRVGTVAALMAAQAGCAMFDTPAEPVDKAAQAGAKPAATTASGAAPSISGAQSKPSAPTEAAPVDPSAQRAFDEARRAMRAGRTDEAERALKALAQAHPELGGAHANLGLIYRNAGKTAEAVAALERAITASPKQPQFQNQLGIAYRHHGQFSKAREAYERAIELDGNYAAAVLNLGILLDMYLGEGPRALPLYERYLALAPAGDPAVAKWVADLKNRKSAAAAAPKAKEKE